MLVWDHVYRIVPPGYSPLDERTSEEAVGAGLLRDLTLESQDKDQARERFASILEQSPVVPDGFTDGSVRVHSGKIDERLGPLLEDASAVLEGDWYMMPRGLARGYMLMLARVAAQRRHLNIGTDSPDAWTASAYLEAEGNVDECVLDDGASELCCHLEMNDIIPVNFANVSVADLAKFAITHRDERVALREAITLLQNDLCACESEGHARMVIADSLEQLQRRKSEWVRASRSVFKREAARSALIVGVPTTMAMLSVLPVHAGTWLRSLGTAVALGAVATLADGDRAAATRSRDLVGSFLHDVDSLHSGERLPHFPRFMNEFVND